MIHHDIEPQRKKGQGQVLIIFFKPLMSPACAFAPYQKLLAERFDLLPSCDSIVMMPSLSGPKPCVVRAWTLNLYGTFSLRFWTVRLVSELSPFTWKERRSPAEIQKRGDWGLESDRLLQQAKKKY